MPRKKSLKRFFKGIHKMEDTNLTEQEVAHEELIEEITEPVAEVVAEPEVKVVDDQKKTSEDCPTCNGRGLIDAETICSDCEGSGVK